MIPNKNLFIITSCINSSIGVFNSEQRLDQTIQTIKSVHKRAPGSFIMLCDSSPFKLEDSQKTKLNGVNFIFEFGADMDLNRLSLTGMKSQAETLLLLYSLIQIQQNEQLMKLMYSIKRIFKLSGRYELTENFNMNQYDNCFGKYVFKKRIKSWLDPNIQKQIGATDLLVTRLFSFCPSLVSNYKETLFNNFKYLDIGLDTEHCHFLNIKKKYLLEFEHINCRGLVAANGDMLED